MKYSKIYPLLQAILQALLEAAIPVPLKIGGRFAQALAEQLGNKDKEKSEQLVKEIIQISNNLEEMKNMIREAGWNQGADVEYIVSTLKDVSNINERFNTTDEKIEQIKQILLTKVKKRPIDDLFKKLALRYEENLQKEL